MAKKVKTFLTGILSVLCLTCLLSGVLLPKKALAEERTKKVTVFSWEDYIDEDLLTEFTEETGIEIDYFTFATNEEMYNEVTKNPKACDLLCPSEYMIMKMRSEDLIKEYEIPETYSEYASPYIKQVFDELGMNTENNKTFAIGYMWGTMGMIYNADKISADDLNRWSAMLNEEYKGKITIKDSVRDTYIFALAIVYEEELMQAKSLGDTEYRAKLNEVLNRTDNETIAKVQEVLVDIKDNLYGFEVDSGKADILTGKIDINYAWSGDAVYSMDEGDEAGVNLAYVVPEEASNVWFDGWVMPKEANTEYATEFLNFISRPENAVRNMEYIGYTSCIAGDAVFENAVDWYGAEYLPEAISQEELDELVLEDPEIIEEYVPYDGGYALKDTYGELIYETDRVYLKTFELDNDGNHVNFGEEEVYKVDLKYFFDPTCTDDSYVIYTTEMGRQLYAQYSDEETIKRCVVMQNFDNETMEKVNEMWSTVKLITLPAWAIIVSATVIVVGLLLLVVYKFKDKIFKKRIPDSTIEEQKHGMKVIKKEQL